MGGEWREYRLSEVYDFRSGLSKPRSAFGTGYGFLTFKDVFYNTFTPDRLGDLVDSTNRERELCSIRRGDVFLTRTSETQDELGMSCVALRDYEAATFNGFCKRLRPKGSVSIAPEYAAYFFRGPVFRRAVTAMSSLSTRASLNEEMLERLTIALPSLETQTRIGRILKTLDDKIELNRRMNATLEAMARALFQSWFVDFDPVHAKAQGKMPVGMDEETAALFPDGFEDSELARIPRGWGQSTLGREVARHGGTIQTGPFGSQLHASDYVDQGVPVVMPKDIVGRRVSPHGVARVRESDAERLSRHRLAPGNIVYSRRGDVERHALIGTIERGWLCGTGCLLVRLGEGWPSPEFASFSLDRPETRAWISQHAVGATMPNLNTAILGDVPMLRIPEAVLRSYATLIRPIQSLTVQTEDESRLHSTLRDTLLPKLLSGELSVEAMAKEVEAVI